MSVYKATGAKAKCDTLFSRIIRFHGACENCDYVCPWECDAAGGSHRKGCKLQCAHVITRHISATRCDLRNAFPLCAKCHYRMGLWAMEFSDFILDRMSRAEYDALAATAADKTNKIDWNITYEHLSGRWAELRAEWELGS